MIDDNVTKLPIKFKEPPADGQMLRIVRFGDCNHKYHHKGGKLVDAYYLIREGETEVECGICGTKLDPMFVLGVLAINESQWNRTRERYQEEMKRLSERSRTKCENCGKMTRISRK